MRSLAAENRGREQSNGTEVDMLVEGTIVDSWVESARTADPCDRLVLQIAPRGKPKDLFIVEVPVSLVSDRLWLQDLKENLCHGCPVLAAGPRSPDDFCRGHLAATGTVGRSLESRTYLLRCGVWPQPL